MPTYSYKCPKSNEIKEVKHGMNECPEIISKVGYKMIKQITEINLIGFDKLGRS